MREHEPDITLGRYDADDWARLNGKGKALRMRLKASLIERAKTATRSIHIVGHQGVILFTAYPPAPAAVHRMLNPR